uniref:BED-type domain-containing protein n=1 Tax=Panagrolaimus sp. PS1159 TaxID=55785 RepID=A0AC35FFR7_9BILA
MSRIERHQRATLRRNEAFEEDDHITSVSNSTTELLSTALSIPRHNLPNSNNNNSSSFDDDDNSFSKAITAAQILGASQTNFPNQPLPAPVPLSINNSLNESALRLFLQQQQIKQEPFSSSSESVWSSKPTDILANQLLNIATQSQLSNFNLPTFMNPVELSAQNPAAAATVAAAVAASTSGETRKPHSFDLTKFAESRNVHSTESTASTSSEPTFRGSDMPRKSIIQDDIRLGKGRFKLVRKRGRSDVWNLFGQVMDNVTGQKLPFVACYACKVLYTDTGGGTGNMTRHRCPLGASYRNITG